MTDVKTASPAQTGKGPDHMDQSLHLYKWISKSSSDSGVAAQCCAEALELLIMASSLLGGADPVFGHHL